MNPLIASEPRLVERSKWSLVGITAVLAVVPAVLIGVFYYGPFFSGSKGLRGGKGDAALYTVQTWRVGKMLGGRWWRQTEPLGPPQPYPPDMARLPHVFEGVDLMLLSKLTSALLPDVPDLSAPHAEVPEKLSDARGILREGLASPVINYNILSVAVLLVNGWVAGWLVWRHTRSPAYAVLAQVLITLNWATAFQLNFHLHWYKHFWTLAVVVTAAVWWKNPSISRSLLFGLCIGLLLQGSWYLFYLLALALLLLAGLLAVCGRLRREHLGGLGIAAVSAGVVGGALTLPYWLQRSRIQTQFAKRDLRDLLSYSSELSQYVIPLWSRPGQLYHEARTRYSPSASTNEIWNYPGIVVLLTLVGYGGSLLRRGRTASTNGALSDNEANHGTRRLHDYLALLSGLLVFVSLAGGVSIVLFKVAPMFRCYGRAGVIATGIWAVLVPLLLHRFSERLPSATWRRALIGFCLFVAVVEGSMVTPQPIIPSWQHKAAYELPSVEDTLNLPGWVPWLAQQPLELRAAVFPIIPEDYADFYWWLFHRHTVLNTCDVRQSQAEAIAAGGPGNYALSPELLDVLLERGYTAIVVQDRLWRDHPWIDRAANMQLVQAGEQWRAYRLTGRIGEAKGTAGRGTND